MTTNQLVYLHTEAHFFPMLNKQGKFGDSYTTVETSEASTSKRKIKELDGDEIPYDTNQLIERAVQAGIDSGHVCKVINCLTYLIESAELHDLSTLKMLLSKDYPPKLAYLKLNLVQKIAVVLKSKEKNHDPLTLFDRLSIHFIGRDASSMDLVQRGLGYIQNNSYFQEHLNDEQVQTTKKIFEDIIQEHEEILYNKLLIYSQVLLCWGVAFFLFILAWVHRAPDSAES